MFGYKLCHKFLDGVEKVSVSCAEHAVCIFFVCPRTRYAKYAAFLSSFSYLVVSSMGM